MTINLVIDTITACSSLNINEAKTLTYYTIATHGLASINKFPILVMSGPIGTGKTTILEKVKDLCHKPKWINGKVSRAELRDSLGYETTALIDEADSVYEPLLLNRYARQSSSTSVKRGSSNSGYESVPLNLFGATALHRRLPFRDPATHSRSITIRTKKAPVQPYPSESLSPHRSTFQDIAESVDWQQVVKYSGNRAGDTWAPLCVVARHLGDTSWLDYATQQIKTAEEALTAGHAEEPNEAVFRALLSLALEDPVGADLPDRIRLARVNERVVTNGRKLNSWQVGLILKNLGFETKTAGGTQYVYTGGPKKLQQVGRNLGIQDEWLEQPDQGEEVIPEAS